MKLFQHLKLSMSKNIKSLCTEADNVGSGASESKLEQVKENTQIKSQMLLALIEY